MAHSWRLHVASQTNKNRDKFFYLKTIFGGKQLERMRKNSSQQWEQNIMRKKILWEKIIICYSSFACTNYLIMSVTSWQKSSKSFQIFQSRFVWFVQIWRISRRRRLKIKAFACLRKLSYMKWLHGPFMKITCCVADNKEEKRVVGNFL